MTGETMNYASVIVTYNRKKYLLKALESILNQEEPPTRVIIVDNASTDGTDELMISNYKNNPIVKYHRLKTNGGGAMGFYQGLKLAVKEDVDWISVADDDAFYDRSFFKVMDEAAGKHPEIKAFTGTVYHGDNEIETLHRRWITNWHLMTEKEVPVSEYDHNYLFDQFTFVGVVLKKELVQQIGFPRKEFFIWYDDSEYSIRVRKQTEIMNIINAKIYHQNVVSNGEWHWTPTWKEYYGIRNRIQIIKKYASPRILGYVYLVYLYVRKMVANTVKGERKGYRKFMYQVINDGFHDGLHNQLGKNDKYLPGMKIKRDNED